MEETTVAPSQPRAGTTGTTPLPEIAARGGERSMLMEFLNYQRAVTRRKAEGLTEEQLAVRLPGHPSSLTVGGIVKHLSWVEVKWARAVFLGLPYPDIGEPWASRRGTDERWEWDVTSDTSDDVLGWYDQAVAAASDAYDTTEDLDALSVRAGSDDPGQTPDTDAPHYALRWILLHLIQEYARHAGHLDLLREQLDRTTGD